MRHIRCVEIDVKANFILLDVKTDHSAIREKVAGFTHRQNRLTAQPLQNCALPPRAVSADKQHVAALKFLRCIQRHNMENPRTDRLAINGAAQIRKPRLVVEDAEVQRSVSAVESSGGPFHELRKVKEERGFDAVLIAACLRAGRPRRAGKQRKQAEESQDPSRSAASLRGD